MEKHTSNLSDVRDADRTKRRESFDSKVSSGLTQFERSWEQGTARFHSEPRIAPLTNEDVGNAIRNLVHINNSGSNNHLDIVENRRLPRVIRNFSPKDLEINSISPDRSIPWYFEMERVVLSVLMHSHFRRGSRERVERYAKPLARDIKQRTIKANPLQLVLPTLAFKDQNPLNTNHTIAHVDLGEYLLMAQMRDLVVSIESREVYPPGMKIVLLTDGVVYANIFANGDISGAEQYRRNCWKIKEELGLRNKVEIVDMSWLVRREPRFEDMRSNIRDRLLALQQTDADVKSRMEILAKGMFWNIPFPGYDFNEVAQLANVPLELLPAELIDRMHHVALDYASFLLTMSHLHIIDRAFPRAIRGTVHPKDAPQIPLHLVNKNSSVFPYNGVPIVSQRSLDTGKSLRESTRIVRYSEVLQMPDVAAVYLPGQNEPFYYVAESS